LGGERELGLSEAKGKKKMKMGDQKRTEKEGIKRGNAGSDGCSGNMY